MNKPTLLMMIAVAVLLTAACARSENAARTEQTATIERAEPKPGELGTDALTQTVELDDGRSVDEGASIIEPESDGTTTAGTTTATTTTATTSTVPPAKTPPPPRKQ